MKRIIGAVVLVLGLAGLGAATAVPAHATININAYVVKIAGTSQAQNNWNGGQGFFNPVNFFADPAGRNNDVWALNNVGRVNGSAGCNPCGPFTTGSHLNATYNGDFVVQIGWVHNSVWKDQTMNASGYDWSNDAGFNTTTPSSPPCKNINDGGSNNGWLNCPQSEEFVFTGSLFLVSVFGSNAHFGNTHITDFPVWLGDHFGSGNGAEVSISHRDAVEWSYLFIEQIALND